MDVAEQVQAMIKVWIDAQARIGQSWLEALGELSEAALEGLDSEDESDTNAGEAPGAGRSAGTGPAQGLWFEALRPALEHFGRSGADDGSALFKFSDLYWDAYERTMGRLLENPNVGYRREFDERLHRSSKAWLEFRRASFDYFTVLGEAWVRTLIEMMSELESLSEQGKTITSLRELTRLWTTVADRVLIETFGREEYSQVQGRLLNAAMAYRLEERQTADVFLKMSHLPTRSEVDEVTRELYQLRREVRALQKELAQRNGLPVPTGNSVLGSEEGASTTEATGTQPRPQPPKGGRRSSNASKGSRSRKTASTDAGPTRSR